VRAIHFSAALERLPEIGELTLFGLDTVARLIARVVEK
jgi:hypothetical protein